MEFQQAANEQETHTSLEAEAAAEETRSGAEKRGGGRSVRLSAVQAEEQCWVWAAVWGDLECSARGFGFVCFCFLFGQCGDMCTFPYLGNVFPLFYLFIYLIKEAMTIPFLCFAFSFSNPVSRILKR